MDKKFLIIGGLLSGISICIADPPPLPLPPPLPTELGGAQISTELVEAQTSRLQTDITGRFSFPLSKFNWTGLCSTDESLFNIRGCQPDCLDEQKDACGKILAATNFLNLFALPIPDKHSIIAFAFRPTNLNTDPGPVLTVPSGNNVFAQCVSVTISGQLLMQVNNDTGSSMVSTPTFKTVLLAHGSTSQILPIYLTSPNAAGAYSASTNIYYVICAAFTIDSSNIPVPAPAAGITATWS